MHPGAAWRHTLTHCAYGPSKSTVFRPKEENRVLVENRPPCARDHADSTQKGPGRESNPSPSCFIQFNSMPNPATLSLLLGSEILLQLLYERIDVETSDKTHHGCFSSRFPSHVFITRFYLTGGRQGCDAMCYNTIIMASHFSGVVCM